MSREAGLFLASAEEGFYSLERTERDPRQPALVSLSLTALLKPFSSTEHLQERDIGARTATNRLAIAVSALLIPEQSGKVLGCS